MAPRRYPVFDTDTHRATRAISFVCVRFCAEYEHNLLASPCVHDPVNQLVTVDNRGGAHFSRLGEALKTGIDQASHDLIALVHEDVFLPAGWQTRFEASLAELETQHPDWGMVGAVGWTDTGECVGHFSDPKRRSPHNSFEARNFVGVSDLDAQLLVLRKSAGVFPDRQMPSIHNMGAALAQVLKAKGQRAFAVNAATIHKYKTDNGSLIGKPKHSAKILQRQSLTYAADKHVSDAYFEQTYNGANVSLCRDGELSNSKTEILQRPLILLGRGGGGTRLASTLALDAGVFLGTELNPSGDSMEMVPSVYRALIRHIDTSDPWSKSQIEPDLRNAAIELLDTAGWPKLWGFKVPEAALVLPWLRSAFPQARYLWFSRDQAGTVLRRTHMTARTDNTIGRAALRAAYDHIGRPRQNIICDSDLLRMAVTTRHQTDAIRAFAASVPPADLLRISFEDTVADPLKSLSALCAFLSKRPVSTKIAETVDANRAIKQTEGYSASEKALARSILSP